MEVITKYFDGLSQRQLSQLSQLEPIYREWNSKVNLISRKDMDAFYVHHVLHSLSLVRLITFKPGSHILDLGTGGGFPGIPLAIFFPDVHFKLIDARAKKIRVVNEIVREIGLDNVDFQHIRAEELKSKYAFVLARAVAALPKLYEWSMPLVHLDQQHGLPNGLITYKGGNLSEEIKALPKKAYAEVFEISDWFDEEYFKEKKLIYVQR